MTPSGSLMEFLLCLTPERLPAAALREARMRLLDSLGCGFFGATTPWGRMVAGVVYEEGTQGRSTVYGHTQPMAPARAALVNGMAIHGFEFDDFAEGSHVHPGAVVVPAVLAIAEHCQLSGTRLLLGVIAGYEAIARIGSALGEPGWGFHVTGIAGPAGAAAACAVALDLPHEQAMRAVGIACSSAAGIKSFTQGSGGMIKRMHAGRAAESGVLACLLAQRGFSAPLAALDGKFGLLEVYGGAGADARILDRGLGERYAFGQVWTKVYPCCVGLHSAVHALYALRRQHGVQGSQLESVRIGTSRRGLQLYVETAPTETMAAQYSLPFSAALALAGDPADPRSFAESALGDRAVRGLIPRIQLYLDADVEAMYPRLGAQVELRLKDGRVLSMRSEEAHGAPADPCSEDEISRKFSMLARALYGDEVVAGLLAAIEQLDAPGAVPRLSGVLRTVPGMARPAAWG